jgi:hypothetical protein
MSYYDNEDHDVEMALGEFDDEASHKQKKHPHYNAHKQPYMQRPHNGGAAPAASVSHAFEKVGGDVKKLVEQSRDLESEQSRNTKQLKAIHSDLQQTKMLSVLLPLLSKPTDTVNVKNEVKDAQGNVLFNAGDKLLKAKDDKLTLLLPAMLFGMGGSSFGGSDSSSGLENNNNNMMMMMMVMAIAFLGDSK